VCEDCGSGEFKSFIGVKREFKSLSKIVAGHGDYLCGGLCWQSERAWGVRRPP
jgi:hypothetical protein